VSSVNLDSGSSVFLPPGSGARPGMNFSELGSRLQDQAWLDFLTVESESLFCYLYETGLLSILTPETAGFSFYCMIMEKK
jgi:hypothetical protein